MNMKTIAAIAGGALLAASAGLASAADSDGSLANQRAEAEQWTVTAEQLAAYRMSLEPTAAGAEGSMEHHDDDSKRDLTAVEYKQYQFGSND